MFSALNKYFVYQQIRKFAAWKHTQVGILVIIKFVETL